MTEAGKYRVIDPDGVLETEADHFMKCPGCGQRAVVRHARALDQVLANAHDAEIEIGEGPGAAKA